MLVLVELLGVTAACTTGTLLFSKASTCALTSPVVYSWSLATLLLYATFASLVLCVPLLSVLFPVLAGALVPVISTLASLATWLSDAGKRGAFGAASILQRWMGSHTGKERHQQPHHTTLANPASTFALYINTSAIVWIFG